MYIISIAQNHLDTSCQWVTVYQHFYQIQTFCLLTCTSLVFLRLPWTSICRSGRGGSVWGLVCIDRAAWCIFGVLLRFGLTQILGTWTNVTQKLTLFADDMLAKSILNLNSLKQRKITNLLFLIPTVYYTCGGEWRVWKHRAVRMGHAALSENCRPGCILCTCQGLPPCNQTAPAVAYGIAQRVSRWGQHGKQTFHLIPE